MTYAKFRMLDWDKDSLDMLSVRIFSLHQPVEKWMLPYLKFQEGKHKGKTISEVWELYPQYILWAHKAVVFRLSQELLTELKQKLNDNKKVRQKRDVGNNRNPMG